MGTFDVTDDTSSDLKTLIDRLCRGDQTARTELLVRCHQRVLRISATIFKKDFPGLHGRHDLESVVSEVWIRLVSALETAHPQTVDGFIGLIFHKVRQVLLDMANRQRRDDARRCVEPPGANGPEAVRAFEGADSSDDPARLAVLTEFHQEVEQLPDQERTVFELSYYGGFSQAEIAQILKRSPKQVSRLWLAATGRLAEWLDGCNLPF